MVLGALGIVKDRHATIYPGIEDKLIGAAPLTDEVVVDGNVITSRAPGTAIPFAIALAELLTDEKTAAALTEDLVFRKGMISENKTGRVSSEKEEQSVFSARFSDSRQGQTEHIRRSFGCIAFGQTAGQRLFSACRQANFPLPQAGEKRCPS